MHACTHIHLTHFVCIAQDEGHFVLLVWFVLLKHNV